jgi:hypothetical protein
MPPGKAPRARTGVRAVTVRSAPSWRDYQCRPRREPWRSLRHGRSTHAATHEGHAHHARATRTGSGRSTPDRYAAGSWRLTFARPARAAGARVGGASVAVVASRGASETMRTCAGGERVHFAHEIAIW